MNSSKNEIHGSLEERNFVTILSDLYHDKSSGYLEVSSDMEMSVYFFNGFVKYVECNDPDLLIGKLLVNQDILTVEQQKEVIDFSDKKGMKVGEALIEQGWLTPHELSHILELQMKLKLINGFRFKSGTYSYTATEQINPDSDIIFSLNPVQITYDAVDSNILLGDYDLDEDDITGKVYPSLFFNKIKEITMSSNKHYRLVELLRFPVSVSHAIEKSPFDRMNTLKFLKFLRLVQLVRIAG